MAMKNSVPCQITFSSPHPLDFDMLMIFNLKNVEQYHKLELTDIFIACWIMRMKRCQQKQQNGSPRLPSHLLLLSFPYFFLLHGLEAALKSCEIKVKYGSFGANNSHRFHKSIHAVIYKKCALVKRLKKTKNLAEVEMITLTQSSSFLVEHRSFTCAPPPDSLRAGSPSGQYLTHAQWQWQPWQLFQLIPDAVVFRKSSWWRFYSDRKLKYGYTSQPRSQVLFSGLERDCLRV